ncbi:homoserine kinase [Candidatus Puniceispirillum marinum]|uniref:Homoserine kinase n=1 Tax=Puniceispirillum marinum (strain IMCC1322) TaxID=488538 RepID=D5BSV3_PUNMI|nr:homoserine kinase [Candidatus Puniceispirillum marinum]ADE39350.1 homoserine kinase [Candidatus Puniceispirillum marinum IMCC1322]
MAVYTEVDDTTLTEFLSNYDIGSVISFAGIAEGVENSNYLLRTTKAHFILTLYEKRVQADDLPFFVELMEHLAGKGMNCPLPVAAKDGSVLSEIMGRPCAIFTFLDGTSSRFPNRTKCRNLGTALAQLHINAEGISKTRPNALGPESWKSLLDSVGSRTNELGDDMLMQVEKRLAHITSNWPNDLPRGIIHADLFPNNVLFMGDDLTGLIDFYFACEDILAYDIGICLNSWCFEADGSFNMTKSRALINGYQSVRKLSDDEINNIPVLAAGSAMRFFLTRLYDWMNTPKDALVSPKDPMEYWSILRFHQSVSGPSAYGFYQ